MYYTEAILVTYHQHPTETLTIPHPPQTPNTPFRSFGQIAPNPSYTGRAIWVVWWASWGWLGMVSVSGWALFVTPASGQPI